MNACVIGKCKSMMGRTGVTQDSTSRADDCLWSSNIFATLGACVIRKYIKYIAMTGDSTFQAKDCLWTLSAWLSQSLSIDCGSGYCSILFRIFLIYHLEIACELWVFDQVCPACLPVRSLKEMEVQFNSKTWIGSFNFNFHFSDQIYVESLTWTIQIEVETQHQFHFYH